MDVSIAYKADNSVGESPFWSNTKKSLYWVDIIGKSLNMFTPTTMQFKNWFFDDFVCGVVPTSNGMLCVALQHDLLQFDAANNCFCKLMEIESNAPQNRINEIKCDTKGRLWIGTMQNNIEADGAICSITKNSGALYLICNNNAIQIETDIGISNTLAWDDVRNVFYFADSSKDLIWRYQFSPDSGTIMARREYFSGQGVGFPDGSAIDVDGNLWNARFGAGCIVKIDPKGRLMQKIELPVTNPTSCCFGGENNSILYVTSARVALSEDMLKKNPYEGSIVAIQTNTKGEDTKRWIRNEPSEQ
ncbi:SMP-30/gluconolactonase/LRE family protein [Aeromonas jandaei]